MSDPNLNVEVPADPTDAIRFLVSEIALLSATTATLTRLLGSILASGFGEDFPSVFRNSADIEADGRVGVVLDSYIRELVLKSDTEDREGSFAVRVFRQWLTAGSKASQPSVILVRTDPATDESPEGSSTDP